LFESLENFEQFLPINERQKAYLSQKTEQMKEADQRDKQVQKNKLKEKKLEKKRKMKSLEKNEQSEKGGVTLGNYEDGEDFSEQSYSDTFSEAYDVFNAPETIIQENKKPKLEKSLNDLESLALSLLQK
jgi:ATP-dependent RNA helicase DDX10/DBP4